MIFLEEVSIAKDIYQNAKMGVLGIDEVIYKVKNKKLLKEISKEKKGYEDVCKMCKHFLERKKEEVVEPNMMAKMGSEFLTQMKLFKDDSDKIIIDMMIKGTEKSIAIIQNKKEEAKDCSMKIQKIINYMLNILNDSMTNLKKIYKFYFFEN